MHEYAFDLETVRLAVVLGVIVSMLFYERLHLTTGGAIVPGYLAVFLPQPLFIGVTLLAAYATFYVVNHLISRRWILYGRLKFEVEILVSLAIVGCLAVAAAFATELHPQMAALYGVGFVIPGIIAHDMKRQGLAKTSGAVLLNTAIVGMVIFIYHSLLRIAPWYERAEVPPFDTSSLG